MLKIDDLVLVKKSGATGIVLNHIFDDLYLIKLSYGEEILSENEFKKLVPTNQKYPSQNPVIKCKTTTTYHLLDGLSLEYIKTITKYESILDLTDDLNGVLEYVCENNGVVTYVDESDLTTILYEFWEV